MNKLNPKIKLGCPACNKLLQNNLDSSGFKTSEPAYNKIVTIIGAKKKPKQSKTISLF